MERSQKPSSELMGMSCDSQRLSAFFKDQNIILVDPKREGIKSLEKEALLWK